LQSRGTKLPTLNSARIKIEVMKRLVRLTGDLAIIENKKYLELEKDLQEISKDTTNWIHSLNECHSRVNGNLVSKPRD